MSRGSFPPFPAVIPVLAGLQVQLIQPTDVEDSEACDKLLVYLPGTDGTGQAILPQIPSLRRLGYDVTLLLRQLLQHWRGVHGGSAGAHGASAEAGRRITIVGESFGCCLALRLAASGAGTELLERLVLVNPATSFKRSLSGISSFIAATNLLSLFPRDLYSVAQATLLPLLVDGERVDPDKQRLLQSMILMEPPTSSQRFGFGSGPGSGLSSADSWSSGSDDGGENGAAAAAASGSGGGDGGTLYYGPAAAANFRTNLLRDGDPGEAALRRVVVPVLLITSARDRLLPSILEGARLERCLPNAQRLILPDSGHAALLERGVDLGLLMTSTGFARRRSAPGPAATEGRLPEPLSQRLAQPGVGPSAAAAGGMGTTGAVAAAGFSDARAAAAAQESGTAGSSGAGRLAEASPIASAVEAAGPSPRSARNGRKREAAGSGGGEGGKTGDGEEPPADIDSAFDEWCQNLAPWRDVISPVVLGFEHLPPPGSPDFARPMLFVGNHQKMGFYDTPLLVYELYVRGYRPDPTP
ncbi:hypothetical protein GPECTOR_25g343 [Gonium pectorale]|uniref:AB hydrolase-1 domain-containing protein n=1 Tax=Gonium pectorale TaxID=33097 RepID=A0A150GFZ4_GONPE|nr:hypothetical protein GPECTOR_25g343 [Gonium pectorale]|eukprot:KXZ48759.1 hypothetical protein GPECTOR_25g343 [Gonium pectorale]